MKLSLAILSLAAVGSALPVQQVQNEVQSRGWFSNVVPIGETQYEGHGRRWLSTALKIGGGISKGLFSAFAK